MTASTEEGARLEACPDAEAVAIVLENAAITFGGVLQPKLGKQAAALLRAPTTPLPLSRESREQIARVIDPAIWDRRDRDACRRDEWDSGLSAGWDKTFEQWVERSTADSLTKADAILALFKGDDATVERLRAVIQGEVDRLHGADSHWAVGIRKRLLAALAARESGR